ncbi:hypothetical protein DFO67_13216 [Modicisalibacter xianhensis]|uniref:LydA family holin superfamily III n=1 Tax=Modicisalibacter xianhensis TaxID=442341 RepID=A0A4R8FGC5_9GAMM|nr:hypothetical protein [Halomonas xianhensis]TDX21897.1 hypothetical protein DFO67_13216 [Halomonas xianhensis]
MPWKSDPDTWRQMIMMFLSTAGAVAIGALARIIDQVQSGKRDGFWTKRLLVDGVGLIAMVFIAVGTAEYFELGKWSSVAVAVGLGRVGPPAIDNIVEAIVYRIRGGK